MVPNLFPEVVEDKKFGYKAFMVWRPESFGVYASSSYDAWKKAVVLFGASKKKAHLVHVHLAEVDGVPVVHVAVD